MTIETLLVWAKASATFGTGLSIAVPLAILPRARRSRTSWAFFWWLVLGGVTNIIGSLFGMLHLNNWTIFLGYRLLSVLLLGWTGYCAFPDQRRRGVVVALTLAYVVLWLGLTISGAEPVHQVSKYTSPGEKLAMLLLGVALVGDAIRSSDGSPLRRAGAWLGIGLVLAGATSFAIFPILAEALRNGRPYAGLIKPFSAVFSHIALLLWGIPYLKQDVAWTR